MASPLLDQNMSCEGICRLGVPLKTVDSGGTFQSLVWSHPFAAAVHNHSSSSSEDARQVCMAGPGHGCHLGMSDILATLRKMRSVAFHVAKASLMNLPFLRRREGFSPSEGRPEPEGTRIRC
ncbi:hypothetical protein PoB_006479300 [Plakobranchus ocellatus]|uniref:Uncharacterized protein n=1 Tax=Plakobranchus ocellatus TaxID=259542 RepID=A0AAV4D2K8_9GAST|nr:hypothetical protein PoB_006479300 [Plakobranchus ocellatus]